MKKLILLISVFAVSCNLILAQKPVKYETPFGINANGLKAISANGIIDTATEALSLIDSLLLNPNIDNSSKYFLVQHKENYTEGKTALVIIQHKLKYSNTDFDSKERIKWQRSCDSLNSLYIKLKVQRKLTDSCLLLLQQKISSSGPANTIDILNFYQSSITQLDSAISGIEKAWADLQPSFTEGGAVFTYVHYYDRYASKADPEMPNYTAYLQGKSIEIMYLILGKSKEISNPQFSLTQTSDPAEDEITKSIALISKMVTTGTVFTDFDIVPKTSKTSNEIKKQVTDSNEIFNENKMLFFVNRKIPDPWEIAETNRALVASVNPDNEKQMLIILAMKGLLPDSLEKEKLKKVQGKLIAFKGNQLNKNEKINMNIQGDDNTYALEIHRNKYFSLRAGMFGSMIDRKLFQLDDSSRLYIQDDTLREKKFWTNGFVVLEWYPSFLGAGFHNDPGRLGPFWNPNPTVPWYYSRLGLYGGCRLSLKPQEAFVTGLSFLIMDDLHFHIGGMAYQMVKNQNGLKVSSYGDADYWKENAPSKYNWYFSFGITLSPSTFLDTF